MKIPCSVVFLSSVFCIASAANAAHLVTYNITADVTNVGDPLNLLDGSIKVGDTLSAILQYDTLLPDFDANVDIGDFDASSLDDNFIRGINVDGFGFYETDLLFRVRVVNNGGGFGGSEDDIEFFSRGDTIPSTLAHPSVVSVKLIIILTDSGGTAFSDDSLPATLNLDDFDFAGLNLFSEDGEARLVYDVEANITSITLVPEPGTLLLGALAAIGLLLRRRR